MKTTGLAPQAVNIEEASDISRVFLGRLLYTWNPRRCHHSWHRAGKFSKFVFQKMNSLDLSVLIFLWKTFSRLLIFTLRNTLLCRQYSKNSYVQIKNLYGYKLVRAAKQSELKRCSK